MSILFVKFRFFFYFYKSKFFKKKIYYDKTKLLSFKNFAEKCNFKKLWFLNNFQIFEYFLPKNLNKKFEYMEVGSYEGLSLFYVLNKYKKVNAVAIDVINVINKKIKNFKNFQFIKSDSIIALRKLGKKNKKFNYIYRWPAPRRACNC